MVVDVEWCVLFVVGYFVDYYCLVCDFECGC